MNCLAVIPARANSTRLPGKNTMLIAGKPSIVWSIEHLQACRQRPVIAVVSDDEETLQIARNTGAIAVVEPRHVAEDENIWQAVSYGMRSVAGSWDAVFLVYPNAPIRPPGIFDRMIDKMEGTGADEVVVLSRVPAHQHPHFLARVVFGDRFVTYLPGKVPLSQDFPPLYTMTAVGSLFRWKAAQQLTKDRWAAEQTLDVRAVTIEPHEWVDIDTELDARWAEFLLNDHQ